ncbi:unnamed protein product [Effrenium voratum]|uniref:Myosin motor domain-containing protein n=1 Tax=Effrenium voratum TaxID=2562239 RepID=A0AA36MWC1_9DINO|nr:unnamed protein product [Effrenium voratum]
MPASFQSSSHLVDGLVSNGQLRNFQIKADEPAGFGGQDSAPNPVEILLFSLGACQEITTKAFANAMGVPLGKVSVELTGHIDLRGFFAVDESVRAGFNKIEGTYTVESPAETETIEQLKAVVDSHCPVKDMLQGVPMDIKLKHVKKPRKGFIAAQLLRSVGALFSLLRSSEPKFVKCVKTNTTKQAMIIDEETVKGQLHTLSIIESLQTERQGFTYKKLYKEFLEEHSSLCVAVHGCVPCGPGWAAQVAARGGDEAAAAKKMVSEILDAVGSPDSRARRASLLQMRPSDQQREGFAFGIRRVFLTNAMQEWCEAMRRRARAAVDDYAASMQAALRAGRSERLRIGLRLSVASGRIAGFHSARLMDVSLPATSRRIDPHWG